MVEFTSEERLQIAQALADDMGGDSVSVGFAPMLPGPVGWVIGALITAGDILHRKIC